MVGSSQLEVCVSKWMSTADFTIGVEDNLQHTRKLTFIWYECDGHIKRQAANRQQNAQILLLVRAVHEWEATCRLLVDSRGSGSCCLTIWVWSLAHVCVATLAVLAGEMSVCIVTYTWSFGYFMKFCLISELPRLAQEWLLTSGITTSGNIGDTLGVGEEGRKGGPILACLCDITHSAVVLLRHREASGFWIWICRLSIQAWVSVWSSLIVHMTKFVNLCWSVKRIVLAKNNRSQISSATHVWQRRVGHLSAFLHKQV